MAVSSATVWEIETGGSDTNGGGFVTGSGGTDYSQQAAKNTTGSNISVTNAVAAGSTTITSATAAFTSAVTGNIIYMSGGTGSLVGQWYQATFVSSTSITVDRIVAVGTGITMNIGGALVSLGGIFASSISGNNLTSGHIIYVQAGTYSISSASSNVSGGVCNNSISPNIIGYSTNRNITNTDTPPLIQFGVNGVSLFVTRAAVYNIAFDGNTKTTATHSGANDSTVYNRCSFTKMNVAAGGGAYNYCTATGNSAAVWGGEANFCEAYANTATPNIAGGASYFHCIHYNNTGASTDGFNMSGGPVSAIGCIAYGNGRAGFNLVTTSRSVTLINCHAENNTTYGFDFSSIGGSAAMLYNCSAYNNTTARYPTANAAVQQIVGFVTVTVGSVFVAAGSNNFALNNTASQGALLRATGFSALFPRGLTASFQDIGAAQHQDTGGGGSSTLAATFS